MHNNLKAVILAGGLGTRISEETQLKPKPMIEIGGKPLLWHIMKSYSQHGINDFIICCGYKGYLIKEYFSNYFLHTSDICVDIKNNQIEILHKKTEPWRITMIDTGELSNTGGRLRRVREYLKDEDCFCFTYGDGLSDVDISKTIEFHKKQKKIVTITAVKPPGRFGIVSKNIDGMVKEFSEKSDEEIGLINGGYFVLSPKAFNFIDDDDESWESNTLKKLVEIGEVAAYEHKGFWQPMDTLREKNILENLWQTGNAPWKRWI
jgi:glucose-1-phosphate cytidylyltransferase